MEADLPSAKLEDVHCSQLKFTIPQKDAKLSEIFNSLCALKDAGLIEDYSVSQTTLDDVKNHFFETLNLILTMQSINTVSINYSRYS